MWFYLVVILIYFNLIMCLSYASGMIRYVEKNKKASAREEVASLYEMLREEQEELAQEIPFSWAWFNEWFDVQHVQMRLWLFQYLKYEVIVSYLPWMLIFWFLPLTTYKLAYRYLLYGCVRSRGHHNINALGEIVSINHTC